ncbi:NAD-dependent epimerase/dehydratase family protein [Haloarchaeobius amylolyticus]|uniref:NAD-dependent epimerase/dehydratase family protein n=1 Tax=Haloarchaeobius amylolyticus TaxID=1198296 RepID=UPI00226F6B72|nr:NAD(P)-dependent oxidoreductase [Haloarchaeobius amylolyticus]
MDVLVTGAFGRVGTALIEHLDDEYSFRYFDRADAPGYDPVVGDVNDYEAFAPAFEGQDAVVHLAAAAAVDSDWNDVLESNLIGVRNCLRAAREHEVETVVFASSNHVVGMYEEEHAPDLYEPDHPLTLDHTAPVRPDSYYGTSKVWGEALCRYFVENFEYPKQAYQLRICSVRYPEYDHPYGDAERGVDDGRWDRDSPEYREAVARLKATWQSRRDIADLVRCCLDDDEVTFDIFYGVSDNSRRWFDIDHARSVVGYEPEDSADEWDRPPETE